MRTAFKIMTKGFQILTISAISGTAICSYLHPIELKGNITRKLFNYLQPYEQYHIYALKALIKLRFLKNTGSVNLQNTILQSGFDYDGSFVKGLQLLGLAGVQIGPVTLSPNKNNQSLGVNHLKSYLTTLLNQDKNSQNVKTGENNNKERKFKIGFRLSSDENIVQFAPYLIAENVLKCAEELIIQQNENSRTLNQLQNNLKTQNAEKKKIRRFDFITLDSKYFKEQIGQEASREAQIMMQNILKKLIILNQNKVTIYRTTEKGHKLVYSPSFDRKNSNIHPNQYKFISWKDIINQIIKQ